MFEELPPELKQQVKDLFDANNFPAAKRLYDEWHQAKDKMKQPFMTKNILTILSIEKPA